MLDILEREAPPTRGFLDGSRPTRVDEGSLEVTVTSAMRADMLGRHEHRERVRDAVATVSGREPGDRLRRGRARAATDAESAGAARRRATTRRSCEEFKTMFRAVEEDGERDRQGGQRWPTG